MSGVLTPIPIGYTTDFLATKMIQAALSANMEMARNGRDYEGKKIFDICSKMVEEGALLMKAYHIEVKILVSVANN